MIAWCSNVTALANCWCTGYCTLQHHTHCLTVIMHASIPAVFAALVHWNVDTPVGKQLVISQHTTSACMQPAVHSRGSCLLHACRPQAGAHTQPWPDNIISKHLTMLASAQHTYMDPQVDKEQFRQIVAGCTYRPKQLLICMPTLCYCLWTLQCSCTLDHMGPATPTVFADMCN